MDHQEPDIATANPNPRTVPENQDLGDEEDMSGSNSVHRPPLDLSGAAIHGNSEDEKPTLFLPNHSHDISHLALDMGGSLIKLVYFSRHESEPINDQRREITHSRLDNTNPNSWSYPILGGMLHFVMFETSKINECLDFIHSKLLHCGVGVPNDDGIIPWCQSENLPHMVNTVIKATGGGAQKDYNLFKERLGITIEKKDEMNCLVAGANFVLKATRHEAFTHMEGRKEFVKIDSNDLYPYLLVVIGSGVSIIKVDGEGVFQRVSGTCLGGGTYLGLGKMLTNCESFDDLLELSQRGDNRAVDMLVGDIYGGDYLKFELSEDVIAASFGKVVAGNKYTPGDISMALLRMISYNIAQISYLNAKLFKIKRIFFGGFFTRDHAYTMDTISFAVNFWSKGQMQAMFLRHEGFLGAIGAFMSNEKHGLDGLMVNQSVERFPMGAPCTEDSVHGSPLGELNEKKLGDCGQFSWTGPSSTEGCTQTIPGLLKNINSKVAELKEMKKKVATMEKTIQKLWIGLGASFVVLFICLV